MAKVSLNLWLCAFFTRVARAQSWHTGAPLEWWGSLAQCVSDTTNEGTRYGASIMALTGRLSTPTASGIRLLGAAGTFVCEACQP